ncbi:transaldolase family protein [Pelosinus fermentans]|uniref:Transaldolase n=1 Tax=Pelosinus fermentans JBW45 TaxID=1192197 RepID=I8TUJ1_9FIRM|nr:transaldolase family protein [Pelosinus fermentans]AJQ26736.1 Transaldolase [Pelosinus fermentans JBW45]
MNILLDSAKVDFIKSANEYYPIDGITTNPTILAKEKRPYIEILQEIVSIIGSEKMLHVQVLSTNAKEIVKEAEYVSQILNGNIYIKIPVVPEGFKVMMTLQKLNIKVTATAVFTPQQALMAAKAGASFVAPYVNRIDNISGDGVKVVADIVKIFDTHHIKTQVLAASFKNVEQVQKVCLAGTHGVTVSEDVFINLYHHPLTEWSVNTFIEDWESVYGKGAILGEV